MESRGEEHRGKNAKSERSCRVTRLFIRLFPGPFEFAFDSNQIVRQPIIDLTLSLDISFSRGNRPSWINIEGRSP